MPARKTSARRPSAPQKMDLFANKFYATITESAANTLTFEEIPTNVDIFSKAAWILERLEWYIVQGNISEVQATADILQVALVASNNLTELSLGDAAVVDLVDITIRVQGTPAVSELMTQPFIRDFSGMAGGGLLVAPRPLYIAVQGTSLANPIVAKVRGYYRQIILDAAQYLDLVDFYRILK